MKKKICIISILSVFLLPIFVHASVKCTYNWTEKDWKIVFETESDPNVLSKFIPAQNKNSSGIKAIGEFRLQSDGKCPIVAFYSSTLSSDKVYSSQEACANDNPLNATKCVGATGTKTEDNKSGENGVKDQAALSYDPDDSICKYVHGSKKEEGGFDVLTFRLKKGSHQFSSCENSAWGSRDCVLAFATGVEFKEGEDCPSYIYYEIDDLPGTGAIISHVITVVGVGGIEDDNDSGVSNPYNPEQPEDPGDSDDPGKSKNPGDPDDGGIGFEVGDLDCDDIFQKGFGKILKQILDIVQFAIPIIIIALSIVDYVKALTAQNQDEIKKSTQKLIKRLIIGVLIFALPAILEFILKIAGAKFGLCGIG